jgi:hypothetical protein
MRRRPKTAPAPGPPASDARFSGMRPMAHDDDERPTREDRASDRSLFDLPAFVPKLLTRGKSRSSE